ncbi:SPOR domain-containing protein [Azoarcus sp. DN11]|uniref:SPOR domain-containing protein n=1 Tax=Azoarcus sp. DN11 TaxID=356837 RepID=UPI000EB08BF0|nr:SPOR domain-containing protein [Azoarcus sp. DN11]AYH44947.1 SPOR domain-containing protein [Azoarcus sp. DN11]
MTDSDNVELKKRARRRLVGAAALALLAAIILPMVMDREPGTSTQDIQVSIPDREADNALSRPIAGRPAREPEPQLVPPSEEQLPVSPPPEVPRSEGAAAAPAPAPAPAPAVKPPAAPKPPTASVAASPARPAVPPAKEGGADSARAQAILEDKPPVPTSSGSSFVVQVGAFSDGGKAASIAADLKKRGFAAYTEKVGAVTRVRIGPYDGRDDAEKAVLRVKASGMSGAVVPR